MVDYVMEALENYDASQLALMATAVENNNFDDWNPFGFTGQAYTALGFDAVRRKMIYGVCLLSPDVFISNDTGFSLWDGTNEIAPDDVFDQREAWNWWTCERDIDTGEVTFHRAYDVTQTVPAGIGGGDGTWRRYVDATRQAHGNFNNPTLVDPWRGDFWAHTFGADFPCALYLFRRTDSFAQIISPLSHLGTPGGGHFEPCGMTQDWLYVWNPTAIGGDKILLTPREITAEETTQDRLLSYADFPWPGTADANYFLWTMDFDDNLYLFMVNNTGARDYSLWKFEPPSSAPWGGPIVGGGWTDITPWGPTTGPNTNVAGYEIKGDQPHTGLYAKALPLFLPESDALALISKFFPADHTLDSRDPTLTRWDCTYVTDLSGALGFEYHEGFVQGYMKGNTADTWAVADDALDADWVVLDALSVDLDLNFHAYDFRATEGRDYQTRTFKFVVQPVVAGAWAYDITKNHVIIVKYGFTPGAPPTVEEVWDEALWLSAYAYMGLDSPMAAVLGALATTITFMPQGITGSSIYHDTGFWDETTGFWYWSGAQNSPGYMALLDDSFAYRGESPLDYFAAMPFLRIGFAGGPPPPVTRRVAGVAINYFRKPSVELT